MMRVVLIGSGNVAYHFHRALAKAPSVALVGLAARRPGSLQGFDPAIPRFGVDDPLPEAEVYLLAVSDRAVSGVARQIAKEGRFLCHTSGALGLDALTPASRSGVLYPLQTFTRGREVAFAEIPLCIEAAKAEDRSLLFRLGHALGGNVVEVDSARRRQLHLAAVFVNNFTNHLVFLGEELCRRQGLPASLLEPLRRETFEKLKALPAFEAQTGPARRGDRESMEAHLALLEDPLEREVYRILSESIQRTYE